MAELTCIVYPPNGGPGEKHTRANARDLVSFRGYTWSKGVPTTPASYAPFAATSVPEGPAPSQRVLDSVGGSAAATSTAASGAAQALAAQQAQIAAALAQAPAPVAEDVVDMTVAPSDDDAALDGIDLDADEPAEVAETAQAEEAPAAPRRGRRPKA